MIKLITIGILSLSLIACTKTVVVEKRIPVPVQLSRPERPSFPKVMMDEVECLNESTEKQILARDMAMKSYISELEDIIDATKPTK